MRRCRLELALNRSLKAAPLLPEDAATAELARQYARYLDGGGDRQLILVGRQYREVLESLGLTPEARAKLPTPAALPASTSLDELRARRRNRQEGSG